MKKRRHTSNTDDSFFILVEREINLRAMDSDFIRKFLSDGHKVYPSYDDAEAGRQRGDAYDNPSATRVIGVNITPFLPKKTNSATSSPTPSKKSKSTTPKPVKKGVNRCILNQKP